jgi:predicted nucleotidyltransferase
MATLFSKGKERMLEFIFDNPNKKIKVRELARHLKLSPAYVSRTLKIFTKNSLIKENNADLSSPYVRTLKIFFNMKKLFEKDAIMLLKKISSDAGVYGSWANGSNYEDSDLDIWIKVDKHPGEMKVATVSNDIRRILGRSVQILVLTPERIDRLKREDPIFYYSLVFGSITLCGESIE